MSNITNKSITINEALEKSGRHKSNEFNWRNCLLIQYKTNYITINSIMVMVAIICCYMDIIYMLVAKLNKESVKKTILNESIYFFDYFYALDIVLRILYKYLKWKDQYIFHEPAIVETLVIDSISLVPYEQLYVFIDKSKEAQVYCRMRVLLRVMRLFTNNRLLVNYHKSETFNMVMIKRTCIIGAFVVLMSGACVYNYCKVTAGTAQQCGLHDVKMLVWLAYASLRICVNTAMYVQELYVNEMEKIYPYCTLISWLFVVHHVAKLACIKISSTAASVENEALIARVTRRVNVWKGLYIHDWTSDDETVYKEVKNYFTQMQEFNGAIKQRVLDNILPQCLKNTILLECATDGLKHSRIFRGLNPHLYRYIASLVDFEAEMPGAIMLQKDAFMDKMIYVRHGILQIMSNEDCETSILNLSGGTCIGDFALIMPTPSPCTVVCKTYCEFMIIRLRKFRDIIGIYPEEYKKMRAETIKRVKIAKVMSAYVKEEMQHVDVVNQKQLPILFWIKTYQRKLMKKDYNEIESDAVLSNRIIQERVKKLLFFVPYLDQLVISDDIKLIADSVFYKTSWPFILKPNSPIISFWRVIKFLMTLYLLLVLPYNICFPDSSSYNMFINQMITIFFVVDIYLQMVTAIDLHGEALISPVDIVAHRMGSWIFIIDCFAVIPFEILALFTMGNLSDTSMLLMQFNRLFKYFVMIHDLSKMMYMFSQYVVFYVKKTIHIFFILYYAATSFYYVNCKYGVCEFTKVKVRTPFHKLINTMVYGICMTFGTHLAELPREKPSFAFIWYIIFCVLTYLFLADFLADVIARNALVLQADMMEQDNMHSMVGILQSHRTDKMLVKNIINFNKMHWNFASPHRVHTSAQDLPKYMKSKFKSLHYMRHLPYNMGFKHLSHEHLLELCAWIETELVPQGQIVCQRQDEIEFIYLLDRGHCKIILEEGSHKLKPGDNIGLFEYFMECPYQNTVQTETDCKFLKLHYNHWKLFLIRNIDVLHCYEASLEYALGQVDTSTKAFVPKTKKLITPGIEKNKSINCGSKFLIYYECFRLFCIIWNCTSGPFNIPMQKFGAFRICYVLDLLSVIDIAMRFFITYYNGLFIPVKSVRKTAHHYLTHAFFIDIIATIPIEKIFIKQPLIYLRLNRWLHLYRLILFSRMFTDRFERVQVFKYLAELIIILLLCNFAASCYIQIFCIIDIAKNTFTCSKDTLFNLSNTIIRDSHSKFVMLLVILLLSFCGKAYAGVDTGNWVEKLFFNVWSVLGLFSYRFIIGKAASYGLHRNSDVIVYQEAMKNLNFFLAESNIDNNVKTEIVEHFEAVWENKRYKPLADVLASLPSYLRMETIYFTYRNTLSIGIFKFAPRILLRNLLMISRHQYYRKTALISRVNDVHGTIFYILGGVAEVVGPDGKLIAVLKNGSLFGSLDDCYCTRQTLTIIAKSHVQTLCFRSREFHALLHQSKRFRRIFIRLIKFHVDYIPGLDMSTETLKSKLSLHAKFFKIYKPSRLINNMELALYIAEFVLFTPFELIFFQLKIKNRLRLLPLLYFRDIFWLIRIYFKFHYAYEDEYGILIVDRRKIALKYLHTPLGFYFDLACNIPIDIFVLFMKDNKSFLLAYKYSRLNRMFRQVFLYNYVRKWGKKLNVNFALIRLLIEVMVLYFSLQVWFCLIAYAYKDSTKEKILDIWESIMMLHAENTLTQREIFQSRYKLILVAILLVYHLPLICYYYMSFTSVNQIVTYVEMKYKSISDMQIKFIKNLQAVHDTQVELEKYQSYLLRIKGGVQFPKLLEEAPYYLREAVLNSIFGYLLRDHSILRNCHSDFIRQLAESMRTITLFENNVVCYKDEIDYTMYFVHEGEIEAFTSKTDDVFETYVDTLREGDSAGLTQIFFSKKGHFYTYKATKLTVLAYISRKSLMTLLTFFPASRNHISLNIHNVRF